jgi:hypothetical protein
MSRQFSVFADCQILCDGDDADNHIESLTPVAQGR